jgi:hypothetical protein
MGSVLSVVGAPASDTSRLTITTKTDKFVDYSAPDAIVGLLSSWISALTLDELIVTSAKMDQGSTKSLDGK